MWYLPENYQNVLIFTIFAPRINKIPEFYMIIARKIFSRFFPTPMNELQDKLPRGVTSIPARLLPRIQSNRVNPFCNANANLAEASNFSEFHIFAPPNTAPAKCRPGRMPPFAPSLFPLPLCLMDEFYSSTTCFMWVFHLRLHHTFTSVNCLECLRTMTPYKACEYIIGLVISTSTQAPAAWISVGWNAYGEKVIISFGLIKVAVALRSLSNQSIIY